MSGFDPVTKEACMVSEETGSRVEWTSEETYRFRLGAFREALLSWLESNPDGKFLFAGKHVHVK